MNTIQTTRYYTPEELAEGINGDFLSNAKSIKGIQVLEKDNNIALYNDVTIEMKIDREIYLPSVMPIVLLQASNNVTPNNRFFTLAGTMPVVNKKWHISVKQAYTTSSICFIFLLEY